MHNVVVSRKSIGLASVTCECGLKKSFERGKDATHHGESHARINDCGVIVFTDNIEEQPSVRRAKPGRNGGGVNTHPEYSGDSR